MRQHRRGRLSLAVVLAEAHQRTTARLLALLRWARAEEVVDAVALKVLVGGATSGKCYPPRPNLSPAAPQETKKMPSGGANGLEML